MGRVYVFHIFHFMFQNKRSRDKMFQSLSDFLMGVAYIYIFVYLTLVSFEYFYNRVSPFDPGALIGIGVLGCIGLIGFALRHWDGAFTVALCLLGGCIGSGMYRFNENPSVHQSRYRAIPSGSERKALME